MHLSNDFGGNSETQERAIESRSGDGIHRGAGGGAQVGGRTWVRRVVRRRPGAKRLDGHHRGGALMSEHVVEVAILFAVTTAILWLILLVAILDRKARSRVAQRGLGDHAARLRAGSSHPRRQKPSSRAGNSGSCSATWRFRST